MKKAFVFPGQGSQFVGMGKEVAEAFPVAKHLFQEVDDALGQHLSRLIFEGPLEELTLTENTQPALMAVSMAIVRVLQQQGGVKLATDCAYLAGHSLGEYTALAAGEAISVADTARLLRIRGQAMQQAVPFGEGAMAALLGSDVEAAAHIALSAAHQDICGIANDNAPGQVVLSGTSAAIDRAILLAAESGKKTVRLAVSAPFHSQLMAPAAKAMEDALQQVVVRKPVVPLIANVTAREVSEPDEIRALLVKQVVGMVRWRESIAYLKECGVENIVEIGAGKVLTGLTKRIDKELVGTSIQTPADIEAFLTS
jgi:[acyl-carrier-protein] S-malonyltransferase